MNTRATAIAALVLAALALGACAAPAAGPSGATGSQPQTPTAEESMEETIYIAPALKDCTGVGPMRCMQVADSPEGPWTLFYSEIEGFSYEEGFAYELKIRKEPVANPLADGSSTRYILVEEVSKTSVALTADALAGTSWALSQLNGAALVASDRPASLEFDAAGRLAGSSGCNRVMGSYTVDGAALTVGRLAGTKMACSNELMRQETAFLDILGRATAYSIADDTLTITADDGQTLVFTRA